MRDTLKEQISQKDELLKKLFATKSLEYKYFMEKDKCAIEEDNRKRNERVEYLKTFRDENKQVYIKL